MANVNPPVTASAAAHAARLRAREEERAASSKDRDTRQTFERYAERAAAGFRADEELREQARMGELRARGVITADEEPDVEADEGEEYEEEQADDDTEDEPLSTASRYAAVERKRRTAEHRANVAAQAGAVQTMTPLAGNQYPARVAQPHRFADRWRKPAS